MLPDFKAFPNTNVTYIDVRTVIFSLLLNPHWSVQISGAPAVCRVKAKFKDVFTGSIVAMATLYIIKGLQFIFSSMGQFCDTIL